MPAWKVPHSLNIAITVMFSYVCIVRKFSKTLKIPPNPSNPKTLQTPQILKPSNPKTLQTPPTLKPTKPLQP